MSTIEQLFARAAVDILVPSGPFSLRDAAEDYEGWSTRIGREGRKLAFYDENLPLILSLKLPLGASSSSSTSQDADPTTPPPTVLNLLTRTQLTLEASYIPSHPDPTTPFTANPNSGRPVSTLPRSASLRYSYGQQTLSSSMLPPQTPVPTPASADWDRKYSRSEGVVMGTFVWGEDVTNLGTKSSAAQAEDEGEEGKGGEKFALAWNEAEKAWVALFRMDITVAYLRTRTPDPLLCLTCSATLRDKPLPPTSARTPLLALLRNSEASTSTTPDVPQTPDTATTGTTDLTEDESSKDEGDQIAQFKELNLLDRLVGPSHTPQPDPHPASDPEGQQLDAPPTGLSHTPGGEHFSLSMLASPLTTAGLTAGTGTATPGFTPMFGHNRARSVPAIMRRAFRKVLPVVSGIKVRMRASFVPRSGFTDDEDDDGGHEDDDAGGQGKRCVLCVEVENAGEGYGFEVERIEVNVSGDDSRTSLVAWDLPTDSREKGKGKEGIFPLRLKAQDQYNILYNVAFTSWNASAQVQPGIERSSKRLSQLGGQRNVVITVHGRPFAPVPTASTPTVAHPQVNGNTHTSRDSEVEYVTDSFPSTWNCTIDITPAIGDTDLAAAAQTLGEREALPTPSPASTVRSALLGNQLPAHHLSPIASPIATRRAAVTDKRATFGSLTSPPSPAPGPSGPRLPSSLPTRPTGPTRSMTLPALNTALTGNLASPPPKFTPTKPSSMMSVTGPNGVSVLVPSPGRSTSAGGQANPNRRSDPPATPAYPPYSAVGGRPRTPMSQLPASSLAGASGGAVEPRRNRVSFPAAASPGPSVPLPTGARLESMQVETEPVIVSVTLQYPKREPGKDKAEHKLGEQKKTHIEVLDTFSLEIFVFNQSSVTRKLIVTYPTPRARADNTGLSNSDPSQRQKDRSGFIPLENQKTIGPLMQGMCQSIQLPFLALRAGIHAIDTLQLHDPDTGYTLNLRQVMTVVVREPAEEEEGRRSIPNGA